MLNLIQLLSRIESGTLALFYDSHSKSHALMSLVRQGQYHRLANRSIFCEAQGHVSPLLRTQSSDTPSTNIQHLPRSRALENVIVMAVRYISFARAIATSTLT